MMESICGGDKPFMSSNALDGEHLRVKDKAMEHFVGRRKMGGAEFSEKYKERLEQVCLFTLSLNCSLLE
jgi:atlastin